jgi:hypothetical protein
MNEAVNWAEFDPIALCAFVFGLQKERAVPQELSE